MVVTRKIAIRTSIRNALVVIFIVIISFRGQRYKIFSNQRIILQKNMKGTAEAIPSEVHQVL